MYRGGWALHLCQCIADGSCEEEFGIWHLGVLCLHSRFSRSLGAVVTNAHMWMRCARLFLLMSVTHTRSARSLSHSRARSVYLPVSLISLQNSVFEGAMGLCQC